MAASGGQVVPLPWGERDEKDTKHRAQKTTEEDKICAKGIGFVPRRRRESRTAYSRTVWLIIGILVVAALAVGEYEIGIGSSSSNTIDLHIYEDDPILQIDHFYPDHIYVVLGQNITLAVQNGDDQTRPFTILPFNINVTITSGTTMRIPFQASKLGNFSYVTPTGPPSEVSQNRLDPCLIGFLIVVQNASLTSRTSTSGHGAPGSTWCNPSNPLQNPPGYPPYSGPNPLNETL